MNMVGLTRMIPLFLLGIVLLVLLVSALLKYLWNITMPQVFGLNTITFWQAFRLLLIAGILFGSFNISLG